jgi:hypothetical protein
MLVCTTIADPSLYPALGRLRTDAATRKHAKLSLETHSFSQRGVEGHSNLRNFAPPCPASTGAVGGACRRRDASRPPSRAIRPPHISSPPSRPRTAGRPSSGSDRHGQTFTVQMLEELGHPREISVAPATETTDREVPVDVDAPYVVGDSASEWFDASCIFTPVPECFPSHCATSPSRPVARACGWRPGPARAPNDSTATRDGTLPARMMATWSLSAPNHHPRLMSKTGHVCLWPD